jgi:energy-coupling factor transport system ATP-binding protein
LSGGVFVSLVEFRDVTFSYPGQNRPALKRVSFLLEEGSHSAIVGGNGSGKSTLARLLVGLLIPQSGQILVDGLDTADHTNHQSIRKQAGLVFQNPSSQIVATVVREDVAFGPENLVLDSAEIKERVCKSLDAVSLSPLSKRGTHQLSAGQQQRLGMAGVLALGSRCLILDEAESMLNPQGRVQLNSLLDQLHEEGYTLIRITHFMDQAVRADQIIILNQGSLVQQGPPRLFIDQREQLALWQLRETPAQRLSRFIEGSFPSLPSSLTEEDLERNLKNSGFSCTPAEKQAPWISFNPHPGESPVIEVKEVSRLYGKKTDHPIYALKNVSFTLFKGESVSVLGQTGSRKSTFLQVLNTILLPDSGSMTLLGENPLNRSTDLRILRSRIGLVMQQPEKQLFANLVGDDVAFGPLQLGLEGRELSLRVKEALDQVGLPFHQYRDFPVKALSGGQKRKAALAGILAMKPDILLLDEPTAGLDPVAAENMEEILLNLQKSGLSLVTVTHNVEQALKFSRRFLVFRDGGIFWDGDAGDFYNLHDPKDTGLDYPLSGRIALALGSPSGGAVLYADDLVPSLIQKGGLRA